MHGLASTLSVKKLLVRLQLGFAVIIFCNFVRGNQPASIAAMATRLITFVGIDSLKLLLVLSVVRFAAIGICTRLDAQHQGHRKEHEDKQDLVNRLLSLE